MLDYRILRVSPECHEAVRRAAAESRKTLRSYLDGMLAKTYGIPEPKQAMRGRPPGKADKNLEPITE